MSRLAGGPQHGILTFLNIRGAQGARAHEIYSAFPRTVSSSILTIMRRKGLIAKAGEKLQTPWVITAVGQEVLATLPTFTPYTYWTSQWGNDIDYVAKRMREYPEYYGRDGVGVYGWDNTVFMNRNRSAC
jgi:hypothetical protein